VREAEELQARYEAAVAETKELEQRLETGSDGLAEIDDLTVHLAGQARLAVQRDDLLYRVVATLRDPLALRLAPYDQAVEIATDLKATAHELLAVARRYDLKDVAGPTAP
jgi:hypothetical protein